MYQVMVLISNRANGNPYFNEVFVDMHGYYDPDSVLKKLKEVGFKRSHSVTRSCTKNHRCRTWEEKGRSFAMGFIKRPYGFFKKKIKIKSINI